MAAVTVRYFARAADLAGRKKERVGLDGATTAAELLDQLVRMHPALAPLRSSVRVSVNMEVVPPNESVEAGDEVGLLPPVAGG